MKTLELEFYSYLQKLSGKENVFKELDLLFSKISKGKYYLNHELDESLGGITNQNEIYQVKEAIERNLNGFFDGLDETFTFPSYLKGKFENWKDDYPRDYANCYGTLCITEIFEVYVRHELCMWDPLNVIYFL